MRSLFCLCKIIICVEGEFNMKKNLFFVALLCLTIFMTSCGEDNTNVEADDGQVQNDTNVNVSEENSNDEEKQENIVEENISTEVELPNTHRTFKGIFYVDVPDFQQVSLGYTQLFKVGDIKYVTVITAADSVATSPKEAQTIASENFIAAMDDQDHPNSINITSEEELTVNNMDVYRFVGTINCGWEDETTWDIYAVGYSFVVDEVPCMILGAVRDESQSQELIDEVTAIVDAMIYTVRDEK